MPEPHEPRPRISRVDIALLIVLIILFVGVAIYYTTHPDIVRRAHAMIVY